MTVPPSPSETTGAGGSTSPVLPRAVHWFTNGVLAFPLLYLAAALGYALTVFARNGFQSRKLLVACLLLSAAVAAGLALMCVRTRWKANLALLGSSAFGALLALESTLAFRGHDYADLTRIARHCRRLGLPYDDRTRLEVVLDERAKGRRAYPCVHPSAFWSGMYSFTFRNRPFLPLSGISEAHTVVENEFGYYFTYEADEFGFHNPYGLHRPGATQVALVGDSYTQGCSVRSEACFAALVRREYRGTLNLGLRGNGPLTELATLREYVAPHRPRAVFWFFYEGNDLADLEQEKGTPLARYLEPGYRQDLPGLAPELNRELARWADEQVGRESVYLLGRRDLRHYEPWTSILLFRRLRRARSLVKEALNHPPPQQSGANSQAALVNSPDFRTLEAVLRRARDDVRAWGGKLVFVYLPQYGRYYNPSRYYDPCAPVSDLVRRLNIPYVDMREPFGRAPDPLSLFPFREGGHYTPEGYRLVADAVLEQLHRILPNR